MSTSVLPMELPVIKMRSARILLVLTPAVAKKVSSAMVSVAYRVNVRTQIVRRIKSAYPKPLLNVSAKRALC